MPLAGHDNHPTVWEGLPHRLACRLKGGGAVAAIVCERGTPSEWYAFTAGKADGRGSYSSFHHCDNRKRIGWADSSWSG